MDPHRAQILKDMGIELWRLRPAAESGARARPAEGAPRRQGAGDASAHRRAQANRGPAAAPGKQEANKRHLRTAGQTNRTPATPLGRRETDERRLRTTMRANSAAAAVPGRQPASAPEAATDAAFTLWAVCARGILLVTGPFAGRRMEILAQDIVRSAVGRWAEPTKLFRFAWPWPGAAGSATPALSAFLDKQIQDFAAESILATSSVAEKAAASGLKPITIPDLEQLDSSEAKRELWRRLQALAATPNDGSA